MLNTSTVGLEPSDASTPQHGVARETDENEDKVCGDLSKVVENEKLRELFRESASRLFHDIIDALNCSDIAQNEVDELWRRYEDFSKTTGMYAANVPNFLDEIDNRLKSIRFELNSLMENTSGKRSRNSCSTDDHGCSTLQHLRKWLHFVADKMDSVNEQKIDCLNVNDLNKVLTDQQALHVEIQRDGGALLAAAKKQISPLAQQSGVVGVTLVATTGKNFDAPVTTSSLEDNRKARVVVESLERRWHCIWIKSLERQCVLETLIKQLESGILGDHNESQSCFEPAKKRQRLEDVYSNDENYDLENQKYANSTAAADCCSIASDTIPFFESEYESIMDANGNVDSNGNYYTSMMSSRDDQEEDVYLNDNENDDTRTTTNFDELAGLDMTTSIYIENHVDYVKPNMNCESLLGQDVGYASENSMQISSNDESLFDCNVGITYDKVELVSVENSLNTNDYEFPTEDGKSPSAPSLVKTSAEIFAENADKPSAWSTSSSPSLERRNRIHNSPIKDYYKMTPDPADLDSDVSNNKSASARESQKNASKCVPDDVRLIYTTKIASILVAHENDDKTSATEMSDSMCVNVSQSTDKLNDRDEIVKLMEESFERDDNDCCESMNQFNRKIGQMFPRGTEWIQLKGGSTQKLSTADNSGGADYDESCDASSELSVECNDDDVTPRGQAPPPPLSTVVDFVVDDKGSSLKRRWLRTTAMASSLAEFLSTSASENAISLLAGSQRRNCSSMSTSVVTVSKHQQQRHHRKKLKARRIPRSVSDSEHLSVLALCQRRPNWSNPRLDAAPPCTPRGSSTQVSCCYAVEDTDGMDEEFNGAGEGMAEDIEERVAGDGGSSVSADMAVWEWDDYKPPNHCEVGPLDNRLDDSTLTAFGDDYRLCLDSAPTSARSDISEPRSFPYSPRAQRLPPVGGFACQDSESEQDEMSRLIANSQRRLRLARHNFNKQNNLGEIGKQCMKEIHNLERFVRKRDAAVASELLKHWQTLYRDIQSKRCDRDEIVKQMIHHLGQSLKQFMDQLSYCHTSMPRVTPSSSYEDLVREISALKETSQKITDGRVNLNALLRENCFVDCPELKICTMEYDVAAEKCSLQLKLMEDFFQNLMDFKNIEKVYKRILDGLIEKSNQIRDLNLPVDSSCHVLPDVTTIYGDIESCEDRLNRLETVCNHLCSTLSPDLTTYEHFSGDLREQLNAYRGQFEALKAQLARELPLISQENRKVQPSNRRHVGLRKRSLKSQATETKKRQNSTDEICLQEELIIPSNKISLKTLRRVLRYSWPVQLCLLAAVCLGVYFLQSDCCSDVNYWNWAFGPRLDYVRGPPPS